MSLFVSRLLLPQRRNLLIFGAHLLLILCSEFFSLSECFSAAATMTTRATPPTRGLVGTTAAVGSAGRRRGCRCFVGARLKASTSKNAALDSSEEKEEEDDDELSVEAFRQAGEKKQQPQEQRQANDEDDFDGYAFRDIIVAKWGACYDVDFNRVDSFGFRSLYLNVLPFRLGKRPFRHDTEYDYLCHLQAVVEILQKYRQLDYVLAQIYETNKRPVAGRSPIVAVPLRLDLTPEQVDEILGY